MGIPARRADGLAALEDAPDGIDRQLVDRHADERQREERRAAHRIDVGDGVGRRDHAEIARIVDDGHEEVRRRDDRLPLVQSIDGGVVGGLDADQQRRREHGRAGLAQDLLQQRGRDLATAAAAVAELREAERRGVGSAHRNPVGEIGGRNAGGGRGPDGSANATGASYRLMQINVAVLPPFASEGAGVASGANGGRARIDDCAAPDVPHSALKRGSKHVQFRDRRPRGLLRRHVHAGDPAPGDGESRAGRPVRHRDGARARGAHSADARRLRSGRGHDHARDPGRRQDDPRNAAELPGRHEPLRGRRPDGHSQPHRQAEEGAVRGRRPRRGAGLSAGARLCPQRRLRDRRAGLSQSRRDVLGGQVPRRVQRAHRLHRRRLRRESRAS